jgi:GNAT superfamily N-acetyltransferase
MRRLEVDDGSYHLVRELIRKDPYSYYWHDVDWKHARRDVTISLAMEGDRCEASLLSWRGNVLQLRGGTGGARFLIDGMDLRGMEIGTTPELAAVLAGRKTRNAFEVDMLSLRRGEENLRWTAEAEELTEADLVETSRLLASCDPVWARFTAAAIKDSMHDSLWLGVREGSELAAVGSAWLVGGMHNIGIIATGEAFRGKGYATSLVSEFARRILERVPAALIHVKAGNTPAERAYYGIGFKKQRAFIVHNMAP